jgi:hypothetical protein
LTLFSPNASAKDFKPRLKLAGVFLCDCNPVLIPYKSTGAIIVPPTRHAVYSLGKTAVKKAHFFLLNMFILLNFSNVWV